MRVRPARLAVAVAAALLVGPLSGAYAHERRTVGPVQMTVGWLNEPSYAGFLNAVQLRITDDAGPITDVGDSMKVDVAFGDQRSGPLALVPAFGSPGEYRAAIVATRPGAYTFRFVGTVRGQTVDQSFTSSEKTFDAARETADIEFPAKDPSRGQLASRLERVEPRIDQVRTAADSEVDEAKRAATRATALGALALAVGVAGAAFGAGARGRRRARPASGSAADVDRPT